jgi:hypothetical protein
MEKPEAPRQEILRPDFQANAEHRYRTGYRLLIMSLMGHRLSPSQRLSAQLAAYTQQRRLNDALSEGQGAWESWSDQDALQA